MILRLDPDRCAEWGGAVRHRDVIDHRIPRHSGMHGSLDTLRAVRDIALHPCKQFGQLQNSSHEKRRGARFSPSRSV
jgi:hypothetical protein